MTTPHLSPLQKLLAIAMLTFLAAFFPSSARAQFTSTLKPVTLAAAVDTDPLPQGKTARIVIKITIAPPYHIQSATPHDEFLIPTSVKLTTPPGIHAETPRFPVATEIPAPPGATTKPLSIYENTVYILIPLTIDPAAAIGPATIDLKIKTQSCNADACNPPETKTLHLPITIAPADTPATPKDPDLFKAADAQKYAAPTTAPAESQPAPAAALPAATPGAKDLTLSTAQGTTVPLLSDDAQVALIKSRGYKPDNAAEHNYSLPFIILFALLGGAILNIMPCVLPVIPLKVLSLVQQAHGDRRLAVLHALAFSAGVISLFVALAIALKTLGLFYGQQFQSPAFLIAMVMFVIALALSMLNVWTINPPQAVYNVDTTHTGYLGSFTNGLMATLLATPCSAPYLGPVLAWALIQPAWLTAFALALVGLGMSIPYLLLAAFPAALNKLPRAGRWTELLKQGLGIVMIGVAVYLVTLIPNVTLWPWVLLGVVVLGLVCWGWGQIPTGSMELKTIWTIRIIVLFVGLLLGGGIYTLAQRVAVTNVPAVAMHDTAILPNEPTNEWLPFNIALLDEALKQNRPVVIDWTADWCINCRSLEAFVLTSDTVQKSFRENRALLLRCDLSSDNPPATAFNEQLGGHAIPVLAIFSPAHPLTPVVLRDSYTPTRVANELKNTH